MRLNIRRLDAGDTRILLVAGVIQEDNISELVAEIESNWDLLECGYLCLDFSGASVADLDSIQTRKLCMTPSDKVSLQVVPFHQVLGILCIPVKFKILKYCKPVTFAAPPCIACKGEEVWIYPSTLKFEDHDSFTVDAECGICNRNYTAKYVVGGTDFFGNELYYPEGVKVYEYCISIHEGDGVKVNALCAVGFDVVGKYVSECGAY